MTNNDGRNERSHARGERRVHIAEKPVLLLLLFSSNEKRMMYRCCLAVLLSNKKLFLQGFCKTDRCYWQGKKLLCRTLRNPVGRSFQKACIELACFLFHILRTFPVCLSLFPGVMYPYRTIPLLYFRQYFFSFAYISGDILSRGWRNAQMRRLDVLLRGSMA